MDKTVIEPNLSITLHDDDLPVGIIISTITRALSAEFDLKCIGIDGCSPDEIGMTVRYRLTKSIADLPEAGSGEDPRIRAHCDLMDEHSVPNGTKAIAIALHAHWTAKHRAQFGEHASPHTVRGWRRKRRNDGRRSTPPLPSLRQRDNHGNRILRGLRRHHAIRVAAAGITMKQGYAEAAREVEKVNAGCHPLYQTPGERLSLFSYETFRRECWKIRPMRRSTSR